MGITSADIAGVDANDALRQIRDLNAKIDWLISRIGELEDASGLPHPPMPQQPSVKEREDHEKFSRMAYEYRREMGK